MSRILEYIAKYDERLTIAKLKEIIAQENELEKQKELVEIEAIRKEFENTYLKYVDKDGLFGEEFHIIKLKNLVRQERTTDWNFIYYFKGEDITFGNWLSCKIFDTDRCGNSFSGEELKNMTKITKEEYNKYKNKFKRLRTVTEKLIKNEIV